MSMIKCPECKKKVNNQAKACPHCGAPIPEPTVKKQEESKKSSRGCLGIVLIFIAIIAAAFAISLNLSDSEVSVAFDASQFIVEENGAQRSMHEQEVIDLIGQPESVEEWNYTALSGFSYPIRSLSYNGGKYVYEFNNDYLLRVQIIDKFEYSNRRDFLKMFNLSKHANTTIKDDNVNYHAYNCGIYDLWLMDIEDTTIGTTYVTYFSGVFE